jgi:hypothetical protein
MKCFGVDEINTFEPKAKNTFPSLRTQRSCNALNLGVEFFLLFSHQIQALLFSFLVLSLNLDLFQSYSGVWLGLPVL